MEQNGFFNDRLGGYTITKLPKAGLYEYIYKNGEILLKLDQYGIQTCQIDAPSGIATMKRERRELSSPAKLYFSVNGKVHDNFDVFGADDFTIDFQPQKAVYTLRFGTIRVATEMLVPVSGRKVIMHVTFANDGDENVDVKVMPCVYPYVNELMMAPWDKPEWYTRTKYAAGETPVFTTTRYSVAGKKEERRYFSLVTSLPVASFELSDERLAYATNNFTAIPDAFSGETENELYAFGQCFAGVATVTVAAHGETKVKNVFTTALYGENVEEDIAAAETYFCEKKLQEETAALQAKFDKLFSVRTVETADKTFDKFVNGFLPLELDWVSALDRGWPTGMRGVRDASNDFEGYIDYDKTACRAVIENIFSKQRSDGWYPRQVPFGAGEKFDLRHFVDSACFFTEYVYDYLASTDDYGLLDEKFAYYDAPEQLESGYTHLKKGIEYLTDANNLGEHGLVKMQGGDWLDCLSSAGIKGRGETVMVSCQLVMCLRYLAEITQKRGGNGDGYLQFAKELTETINAASYNESGFYNGVFTDNGEWIFSEKDSDGEKRIYAPTNSYAIISGVACGKEKSVVNHLESLKTSDGYKLFSTPFGVKTIDGIGKMGTGDFQPYFAENASVYNHGSQLFYARALAKAGEHEKLYDALNYAMPFNGELHKESSICAAPYAITNCYHLVPSFYGRTGFSFLTGSVAMIERAVYNWLFGVQYTLDTVAIRPCIPEQYKDAKIKLSYGDTELSIRYEGYGNTVVGASLNGKELCTANGEVVVGKSALQGVANAVIVVRVK